MRNIMRMASLDGFKNTRKPRNTLELLALHSWCIISLNDHNRWWKPFLKKKEDHLSTMTRWTILCDTLIGSVPSVNIWHTLPKMHTQQSLTFHYTTIMRVPIFVCKLLESGSIKQCSDVWNPWLVSDLSVCRCRDALKVVSGINVWQMSIIQRLQTEDWLQMIRTLLAHAVSVQVKLRAWQPNHGIWMIGLLNF